MIARLCLDCSRLVKGASRCVNCQRAMQRKRDAIRGTSAQRGYDAAYRRLRFKVLEEAGYVCTYCGGPATTADHLVPLSRGGLNVLENLVAACGRCNYSRGGRL